MSVNPAELKSIKSLTHLTDDQLVQLAPLMIRQLYRAGELIFLEGEPAQGVWFLLEGRVRIIKQSVHGRVQGLCITRPGKCFGGCPMFDDAVNPASAEALDQVTLLILPSDATEILAERDPQLLWMLLKVYSHRVEHLARLSEGLGAWSVGTRINDCLVVHAEDGEVVLTQERLAELVGTVREVVSRHLSCLEKEGVIRVETGRITILEYDSLRCGCLTTHVT